MWVRCRWVLCVVMLSSMANAIEPHDVVRLRDGSIYWGRITEVVPGDHVTLTTLTGDTKRIPMASVVYEGPAQADLTPQGGLAHDGQPTTPAAPTGALQPSLAGSAGSRVGEAGESSSVVGDVGTRQMVLQTLRLQLQALQNLEALADPGVPDAFEQLDSLQKLKDLIARLKEALAAEALSGSISTEELHSLQAQIVDLTVLLEGERYAIPVQTPHLVRKVPVHFVSSTQVDILVSPAATVAYPDFFMLMKDFDAQQYQRICQAPCTASLPNLNLKLGARLESGEPVIAETPISFLPGSTLTVDYHTHSTTRLVGWVSLVLGSVLTVGGIPLLANGSHSNVQAALGGTGLVIGSGLLGLIPLVAVEDEVEFSVQPPANQAPVTPTAQGGPSPRAPMLQSPMLTLSF